MKKTVKLKQLTPEKLGEMIHEELQVDSWGDTFDLLWFLDFKSSDSIGPGCSKSLRAAMKRVIARIT